MWNPAGEKANWSSLERDSGCVPGKLQRRDNGTLIGLVWGELNCLRAEGKVMTSKPKALISPEITMR